MRRGDRRLAPIGGELVLHDLPKLRIEDGLVLAGVGFALVNNVAPLEPVLQHQIECPAGEMLAAGQPSGFNGSVCSRTICSRPVPSA